MKFLFAFREHYFNKISKAAHVVMGQGGGYKAYLVKAGLPAQDRHISKRIPSCNNNRVFLDLIDNIQELPPIRQALSNI